MKKLLCGLVCFVASVGALFAGNAVNNRNVRIYTNGSVGPNTTIKTSWIANPTAWSGSGDYGAANLIYSYTGNVTRPFYAGTIYTLPQGGMLTGSIGLCINRNAASSGFPGWSQSRGGDPYVLVNGNSNVLNQYYPAGSTVQVFGREGSFNADIMNINLDFTPLAQIDGWLSASSTTVQENTTVWVSWGTSNVTGSNTNFGGSGNSGGMNYNVGAPGTRTLQLNFWGAGNQSGSRTVTITVVPAPSPPARPALNLAVQ